MRPRFRLEVPLAPHEVHERLRSRLACAGCPCRAEVAGHHVEVMIRDDLRHAWSPRLSLEVHEHPDGPGGGAALHGLFGPAPNVWTMFLAAYAVLLLSAAFFGLLGLVQARLGVAPWGLWAMAACLLGCALPYAGSRIGQRLAADQMELLRCFLEESLGLPHARAGQAACPPTARGEPASG